MLQKKRFMPDAGVLIILIVLKTISDVKFHLRQYKAVVSIRQPFWKQERSGD